MKAEVLTLDAKKAGDVELDEGIYALPERADILQRVVVWQLAKRRAPVQQSVSESKKAAVPPVTVLVKSVSSVVVVALSDQLSAHMPLTCQRK